MGDRAAKLGKVIRLRRERFGLSQEELAGFAGLNRTSMGELERGEINPSFETLCRIAGALHTPLSELVRAYEQ